jgi:hypothetical protein
MNRRKLLLLFLSCSLFLIGAGLYFFLPKPQYAEIPVYYKASSDIPVVDLEIESKKYVMEFDTGAQHYIALQKRCLDQIVDKIGMGTGTYCDLHGRSYERPAFQVPKIQIKNFTAYPMSITQEDPDYLTKGSYVIIEDLESAQKAMDEIDGRIGGLYFSVILLVTRLASLFDLYL